MNLYPNFNVLLLFILIIISGTAGATDYNVTVQQLNPDHWTYSMICKSDKIFCHVFMGIEPQNDTYNSDDIKLDVGIAFTKNSAYFQFRSGSDYFFLPDGNNHLYLPIDQEMTEGYKTALYARHPMAKRDPPSSSYQLLVVRPEPKMFAELEITIKPTAATTP